MTPSKVVARLEEVFWPEGEPCRLTDAIERELIHHFGNAPIAALERAERLSVRVAALINDGMVASLDHGVVPRIILIGTAGDIIAGGCRVFPNDAEPIANLKRNRQQTSPLLTAMRSLTFQEFEQFGRKVLIELGATFAEVTPSSGDEGLDFFGELNVGDLQGHPPPFFKLARDVRLGFVGQAKHYPTRTIGPDVVREVAGAVALAKAGAFSKEAVDLFDRIELKSHSPIQTLLLTTGKISSGAVRLADAAGIIARSGEQLAVFLAEKGVGMSNGSAGSVFDPAAFREWLAPS